MAHTTACLRATGHRAHHRAQDIAIGRNKTAQKSSFTHRYSTMHTTGRKTAHNTERPRTAQPGRQRLHWPRQPRPRSRPYLLQRPTPHPTATTRTRDTSHIFFISNLAPAIFRGKRGTAHRKGGLNFWGENRVWHEEVQETNKRQLPLLLLPLHTLDICKGCRVCAYWRM